MELPAFLLGGVTGCSTSRRRHGRVAALALAAAKQMLMARGKVWSEALGVDRVPPAVGTLNNHVKVIRVHVSIVLLSVLPDSHPQLIFERIADGVLGGVHVRHMAICYAV